VHANASLFKAPEIKRAVQGGQAQIGEVLLVNYQNEWQPYGIDGLPFLADSYADSMKLYKASKPALEKKLGEQGIMLLYTVPWPPQGIYVNKPINSAADLKGVKWRAYSPATARVAELVGAQPVTVQAAELSQAMATGVVESYMSSGSTGYDTKTYEHISTGTTRRRGCRRTRCSSTRPRSTRSTRRRRQPSSRLAPTPRRVAGRSRRKRTASTSTC
jgi:TRAP-type C4-dicarboxylate transport system substrate-binding protein